MWYFYTYKNNQYRSLSNAWNIHNNVKLIFLNFGIMNPIIFNLIFIHKIFSKNMMISSKTFYEKQVSTQHIVSQLNLENN